MELEKGVAQNIQIFLTDPSDHSTGKTGRTITPIKISKNGAAFATITPTVTELGNGWYNLALLTGDVDTLGGLALHADASGADPYDERFLVVEFINITTNGSANFKTCFENGGVGGTIKLSDLANLTTANITAIVNGVYDEPRSSHTTVGTYGEGVPAVKGNVTGSVASVTGNVGGNVTGNVSGNVTGSVGSVAGAVTSIAAGGITNASVADGFLTSPKFATDAIGASALATAAVSKIWTTALTEAYATDGSTFTGAQAFYMLWALMAEASESGTTLTAKKLDGSTTGMTFTLNSSTAPTSITRAS
jgi:hypothetical protein